MRGVRDTLCCHLFSAEAKCYKTVLRGDKYSPWKVNFIFLLKSVCVDCAWEPPSDGKKVLKARGVMPAIWSQRHNLTLKDHILIRAGSPRGLEIVTTPILRLAWLNVQPAQTDEHLNTINSSSIIQWKLSSEWQHKDSGNCLKEQYVRI